MKPFLLISLALLLSGCISTEHSSDRKNDVASANADGLVCKREKPTGSHRSIKICRTVSDINRERDEAAEISRRIKDQTQIN